jgi:putative ABC transport system permease protein
MTFYREDQMIPKPGQFPSANSHFVTPDYFQTMGIPLVRGRFHTGLEPQPAIPIGAVLTPENLVEYYKGLIIDALISQRMAEQFWPGEDPIGKRFRLGNPEMKMPSVRIIGIVGSTVQAGLDQPKPAEFYAPLRQFPFPFGNHLLVRARTEAGSLVAGVQNFMHTEVKTEPVRDIQPMLARIEQSLSGRRFNTRLLATFSLTALALGLVGIYGVLSFVVGQRTRDIAVRMAFGARQSDVLRNFLWRDIVLALTGTGLGLGGAWAFSRLLQNQLYGVSAVDPLTYGAGAVVLLAAALIASLIPARRAARIEPAEALRAD